MTLLNNKASTIEELSEIQLQKFKRIASYVKEHSKMYGELYKDVDFQINKLEDVKKLPFTTKQDVAVYKLDNRCVDFDNVVEVHTSSGTSQKAIYTGFTHNDIEKSNEYLSEVWKMQGIKKDSVFLMLASYGLFSAGLINHYAIQKIGALVIPTGSTSLHKVIDVITELKPNSAAAVTSYYMYLIEQLKERGVQAGEIVIDNLIAGGEPFTEQQRNFIEEFFSASLYAQYGLAEINTGIAGECEAKNGMHICADYVYPEIIDPQTGNVLPDSTEGELVLTTLDKETMPLVRYRTGDLTSITYEQCSCGRMIPRIDYVRNRVGESIFYKGMTVDKNDVISIMETLCSYVHPYTWCLEFTGDKLRQVVTMSVVLTKKADEQVALVYVQKELIQKLGFKVTVQVFPEAELTKQESSKLKYLVDNRV